MFRKIIGDLIQMVETPSTCQIELAGGGIMSNLIAITPKLVSPWPTLYKRNGSYETYLLNCEKGEIKGKVVHADTAIKIGLEEGKAGATVKNHTSPCWEWLIVIEGEIDVFICPEGQEKRMCSLRAKPLGGIYVYPGYPHATYYREDSRVLSIEINIPYVDGIELDERRVVRVEPLEQLRSGKTETPGRLHPGSLRQRP